jgi:uncharacterized protein YdiU (UPF0061 family)
MLMCKVPNACFSRVLPTPVKGPELMAVSTEALSLLGLSEEDTQDPDFVEYFSGAIPLKVFVCLLGVFLSQPVRLPALNVQPRSV